MAILMDATTVVHSGVIPPLRSADQYISTSSSGETLVSMLNNVILTTRQTINIIYNLIATMLSPPVWGSAGGV